MSDSLRITPSTIRAILFLQFIPILLFPPSTFTLASQAWWLPLILVILSLTGVVQLLRKTDAPWPLNLIGFAQGFNIISRLLMLMPQAVSGQATGQVDVLYITLTILSMVSSAFVLWFIEKPAVKQALSR